MVIFRLRRWFSELQTKLHMFRLTQKYFEFKRIIGLSPVIAQEFHNQIDSTDTSFYFTKLGLIRVRSPLLTESRLISFPMATKMFQFAT